MTVRIIQGDCRDVLPTLPAESFDCVVTSPPYWGLRDYGTASWEGGDAACDHSSVRRGHSVDEKQATSAGTSRDKIVARDCPLCGARRIDAQIGLEPTLDAYVETMVGVFREVRRVLKPSGTCWLNLGSSYFRTGTTNVPQSKHPSNSYPKHEKAASGGTAFDSPYEAFRRYLAIQSRHFKAKDLVDVPHLVAMALQADGWWLRSAIVWAKKNAMPESVTDRPTSAYEMVFLLTKSSNYFYDSAAIAEEASVNGSAEGSAAAIQSKRQEDEASDDGPCYPAEQGRPSCGIEHRSRVQELQQQEGQPNNHPSMRNARNVWTIATQPYRGSHFATMPPDLAERCIKAGSSEKGCCPQCGAPWERIVERTGEIDESARGSRFDKGKTGARDGGDRTQAGERFKRRSNNWRPMCSCPAHEPIPARVLDPFGGSGTTGMVADRLRRDATLIELGYPGMALERISNDAGIFAAIE